MFYYSPYLIPPFFSSLVTALLTLYLWRRRKEPIAQYVCLMTALLSTWSFAYVLQTASTELWLKALFYKVGTTCVYFIAPTSLCITLEASGFGHLLTRRTLLFIVLAPLVTLLSAWTLEFHSLNRYDLHIVQSGPLLVMGFKTGPFYVLHYFYITAAFVVSMVFLLIGSWRGAGTYRLRCLLLFMGTVPPFAADHLNLTPFKGFSTTTSTLWFTGICYTLAIFRYHLLDVLPAARSVLFEELGDPILVLDRLGRLTDGNRAASRLFTGRQKAGGALLLDAARRRIPLMDAIMASPSSSYREVVADLAEEGRYWQVSTIPLDKRGYFLGSLIQFHDITELKAAESTLEAARAAAEEASRTKSRFLATVSHELRTPLQAIIGFSELVQEMDVSGRTAEYMTMINDASISLLDLLNDILDLSRIEAGRIEIASARFSIRGQLRNLAVIYGHQAGQKDVAFSLNVSDDVPDMVLGDPLRVRQVLTNIVGNAVKFTKKGSVVVDVSLCPPPPEGAESVRICFTVRDTGIGIPEGWKDKVFDSFSQADPDITRLYGGSGLGAAIARRLAVMMGGDVTFESREGMGSEFHVVIPFSAAPAERPAAPARPVSACRPLSILLVEDNLFNQRLLVDALALRGHDVTLAGDGNEALEQWRKGRFDLILMDLMMPVMDGYEAARRIRALETERLKGRTPIIAVTANTSDMVRKTCLEAGMDDFIAKPVTSQRLDVMLAGFGFGTARAAQPGKAPPPPGNGGLFDPDMVGAVAGNPERAAVYSALLLADLERDMGRLTEAFSALDRDAMSRAAHSIKGAARPVLGFMMSAIAEKMQSEAEAGSEEQLKATLGQLQEAHEQVRSALKKAGAPS